jgi:hypothetical protein
MSQLLSNLGEVLPQFLAQIADSRMQESGGSSDFTGLVKSAFPNRRERAKEELMLEKARSDIQQSKIASLLGIENIKESRQKRQQSAELMPLQKEEITARIDERKQRTAYDRAQEQRNIALHDLNVKGKNAEITAQELANTKSENLYESELRRSMLDEDRLNLEVERLKGLKDQEKWSHAQVLMRAKNDADVAKQLRESNPNDPEVNIAAHFIEQGDYDSAQRLISSENRSKPITFGIARDHILKNDRFTTGVALKDEKAAEQISWDKADILTNTSTSEGFKRVAEKDIELSFTMAQQGTIHVDENSNNIESEAEQKNYLNILKETMNDEEPGIFFQLRDKGELDTFIHLKLKGFLNKMTVEEIEASLLGKLPPKTEKQKGIEKFKNSPAKFNPDLIMK